MYVQLKKALYGMLEVAILEIIIQYYTEVGFQYQ